MSFTDIKTPGVYVKEINLFPPSVAAVATAIPAFIGYTEKAIDGEGKAITEPVRIKSLAEYLQFFGAGFTPDSYTVSIDTATLSVLNITTEKRFHLFDEMRQYFDNGGGPCYILSIGNYSSDKKAGDFTDAIEAVNKFDEPTLLVMPDAVELKTAADEADIDAFASVQTAALAACAKTQDRFAILDIIDGFKAESITAQPIKDFRDKIGINNLKYGAAYYPWLITTYDVKVNFRQLKFKDEADADMNMAALLALNVSANEKNLLSRLKDEIKNSDELITFAGIEKADIIAGKEVAISDKLSKLESKIKDANTSAANKKTALADYLDLVQTAMLGLIDAEGMDNDGIKRESETLKADADLQTALKTFISIEKNEGTLENVPDGREDTLEDIYDAFDDGWLGDGATDNFADIDAGTAFADTDEIFEKLTETVPVILLKYASLINNVLFYENQATALLFAQHSVFKSANDRITEFMRTVPPSGAMAGIYAFVDGTRGVWKAPANVSISNVVGPTIKLDNQDQDSLNVHDTGKSINALRSFTGKGTLVWGARTLAGNDNEWRYISVRRFFNMVEESVLKATNPFVFENNDANTWTKVKVMVENFLTLQWRAGALQGAKPEDAFFVHVGLGSTMTANDILEGRMIVEIGMAVVRPAEFIILRFSHKMVEA